MVKVFLGRVHGKRVVVVNAWELEIGEGMRLWR